MKKLDIDWDEVPLGEMSDRWIASVIGCDISTVGRHRKKMGLEIIRPFGVCACGKRFSATQWRTKWCSKLCAANERDRPFGAATARLWRLIPNIVRPKKDRTLMGGKSKRYDWSEVPLGEMPDTELAKLIGAHKDTVTAARHRMGIPKFVPIATCYSAIMRRRKARGEVIEDGRKKRRCVMFDGRVLSTHEVAKIAGVSQSTVMNRLKRGYYAYAKKEWAIK